MKSIKAIIKRPDEPVGHLQTIPNDLRMFQRIVDGYIETVRIDSGVVTIVNDCGKLRGLPFNFSTGWDSIVGTVILVGEDGEEFGNCPISLRTWGTLLSTWGNRV